MKILSLTQGDTDNLGDQAIQKTINEFFTQRGAEVISAQFYPEEKQDIAYKREKYGKEIKTQEGVKGSGLKRILKKILGVHSLHKKLEAYRSSRIVKQNLNRYYNDFVKDKKIDLVLIGGGQLIKHNHDFIHCMDFWCRASEAPKAVIGIGSDTNLNRAERKKYKNALSTCGTILVRDTMTEEIIKNMGLQCTQTPDVAFLFSSLFPKDAEKKEEYLFAEIYAYNEHLAETREEYYAWWEQKILSLNPEGGKVVIGYSTYDDYLEAASFFKYLNRKNMEFEIVFENTDTLERLLEVICGAKTVLSGRMHVLILAINYQKEVHAVEVSDKLKNFNQMYIKRSFDLEELQKETAAELDRVWKKVC